LAHGFPQSDLKLPWGPTRVAQGIPGTKRLGYKQIEPKTPEQQRVASLRQRVPTANQALKSERQRQTVQKAQAALTKAGNAAASPPARKP
jgi:hypothetical protein